MKIDVAIQLFADYITVERRLAPSTCSYYIGEVTRFGRYLQTQQILEVDDIESYHVRNWQMGLLEDGESPGTITKQLAALRAWFKYLRKEKYCSRDIMVKITPPKMPKRLPVFFRESDGRIKPEAAVYNVSTFIRVDCCAGHVSERVLLIVVLWNRMDIFLESKDEIGFKFFACLAGMRRVFLFIWAILAMCHGQHLFLYIRVILFYILYRIFG